MENILIYNKEKGEGVDIDIIGNRLVVDHIDEDDFLRD